MKRLLTILIIVMISVSALSAAPKSLSSLVIGNIIDTATGNTKEVKAARAAEKKAAYELKTIKGLDKFFLEFDGNNLLKEEKDALYDEMKQNMIGPVMMNLFVGFGTGSRMVGNNFGYTFGLIMDLIPVGAVTALFCMSAFDFFALSSLSKQLGHEPLFQDMYKDILIASGIFLGASHLIQVIFPIVHVSKYNKKLANYLDSHEVNIALIPNENLGLTAAASIKF